MPEEHRSHFPPRMKSAVLRDLEVAQKILDASEYGTWDVQMDILRTTEKIVAEAVTTLAAMRDAMLKEAERATST